MGHLVPARSEIINDLLLLLSVISIHFISFKDNLDIFQNKTSFYSVSDPLTIDTTSPRN